MNVEKNRSTIITEDEVYSEFQLFELNFANLFRARLEPLAYE